jgi:transposase
VLLARSVLRGLVEHVTEHIPAREVELSDRNPERKRQCEDPEQPAERRPARVDPYVPSRVMPFGLGLLTGFRLGRFLWRPPERPQCTVDGELTLRPNLPTPSRWPSAKAPIYASPEVLLHAEWLSRPGSAYGRI